MKIYTKVRIIRWVAKLLRYEEPTLIKLDITSHQIMDTKTVKLLTPDEHKYLVANNYLDKQLAFDVSLQLLSIKAFSITSEPFHGMGKDMIKVTMNIKHIMP